MAAKFLLPVDLEVTFAVVYNYCVIHRLACKILAIRMHSCCWNCMHVWLTYVLCDNWDTELPHIDLFIICSWNKSASILNKCYGIDRAKMFFVLLYWLFGIYVVLYNFFIWATSQEYVLLIIWWVELNAKRSFFVWVVSYNFSSFSVP